MHRILWSAADRLIRYADEDPDRRWYAYVSLLLMSFFAFEGFLDYVGEELFPEVWRDEQDRFSKGDYRGTAGKLKFLAHEFDVPLHWGRRPYQSFVKLHAFRHDCVHPRHETVDAQIVTSVKEIGQDSYVPDIAKQASVHRIRADLEKLAKSLFDPAKRQGLRVTGESLAMVGTIRSMLYDDIP